MKHIMNISYASSLTDLCEVNSSFDSGILRIAYAGENRNKSRIDKSTFERCISTIYNCPIVCNYDRETDTLGGHDVEVIKDHSGNLKMVNITEPVGVVPESARVFWDTVEEDDGSSHEYLCAEVLLWKRQEAYQKIKDSGCTKQSMEITVKDGEQIDGVYNIYDFEFTAFALIGCEPCFESAALEFSKQDFKSQFSQMMLEIKESFKTIDTSKEDDNTQQNTTKGGSASMNDKLELLAKLNISAEDLDFSIEDISIEELESRLAEFSTVSGNSDDDKSFELEGNFQSELIRVLESEKAQREWGEVSRYLFVDYDRDNCEVFCFDINDWLLYGLSYKIDGDSVSIDFGCKKRKKYQIVDFDEGSQTTAISEIFNVLEGEINSRLGIEKKYNEATETLSKIEPELKKLREFKANIEKAENESMINELFAKFLDLEGIEAFENLKLNAEEYSINDLEEKCFAIRGRNLAFSKPSGDNTKSNAKLKIDKKEIETEPYGGVFRKYGVETD